MSLVDKRFIGFAGEPEGGRTHARLEVRGPELSGTQLEEVIAEYYRFYTGTALSVAQFHTQEKILGDGTRIRMQANSGLHTVQVWPPEGGEPERLPHGFAVKAPWLTPFIYCRDLEDLTWSRAPDPVPQVADEVESANQLLRVTGTNTTLHPQVLVPEALWDYEELGLTSEIAAAQSGAMLAPMRLQMPPVGGAPEGVSAQLYARENLVLNSDGDELHEATMSSPINGGDPETPTFLPPVSSSDGGQLILAHTRQYLISPTFDIWEWRARSEAVELTAPETFNVVATATDSAVFPVEVVMPSASTSDELGEDMTGVIFLYVYNAKPGAVGATNGTTRVSTGFQVSMVRDGEGADPWRGYAPFEAEDAFRETILEADNSPTTDTLGPFLLLPENGGARALSVEVSLNYILTMDWRGGIKQRYMDTLMFEFMPPYAGLIDLIKQRIDSNMEMAGTPSATINLGWLPAFEIFGGTTTGVMAGQVYRDIKKTNHTVSFRQYCEDTPTGFWDYVTAETPPGDDPPLCIAVGIATDIMAQNYAQFIVPFPRWTEVGATIDVRANSRPENTGGYALTSRHIIDYDHKGQFYVAVKVTVECSGAQWVEDIEEYEGCMVLGADPTYDVHIELETKWGNKPVALQTLYEESHTRPAFEFITYNKANPFRFPDAMTGDLYPTYVRMPPNVSLPVEAMRQLNAIGNSQATNTNIAVEDAEGSDDDQSEVGIEYSWVHPDGQIKRHNRFATGQLYARTFALNDVMDALWLLKRTKCNAKEDDGDAGPEWFYMPGFADFLAEEHHVEVRDGVFETWSDEFELRDDETRPAAVDRDLKLYRV